MNSKTYQQEKTEYDIQAEKFLKETGTEFKAVYLKHDKYFEGDKEKRDIYNITLTRGERSYSFKFGQSLNDSGYKLRLKNSPERILKVFTEEEISEYKNKKTWKNWENAFFFQHRYTWNSTSDYFEYPKAPGAYSVLACVEKYGSEDFADFCANYGYDEDSRSAERIFKACQEQYTKLCTLYSPEEMDKLREIQ